MEEEASVASNAATNLTKETSDSHSSHRLHLNKRTRHDVGMSTSSFKGVVAQQNGHWGAQIYANHRRIWLGTFKSEREAAWAYDSAAISLRSGDSHRNFPRTDVPFQESHFQRQFTTEEVLTMIRDGTYPTKFAEYRRMQFQTGEKDAGMNLVPKHGKGGGLFFRQLFRKELTPSDVGKLNRLVIPKKYALSYFSRVLQNAKENPENGGMVFPHTSEYTKENPDNSGMEDRHLVFYDRLMRSWRFRYCYWKSSQSYVFTRGWNRFVKENALKEKDTVIFSECECGQPGTNSIRSFFMIEVVCNDQVDSNGSGVEDNNCYVELQGKLQLDMENEHNVDGEVEDDVEEGSLGLHLGLNLGEVEDDVEEGSLGLHLGLNLGVGKHRKKIKEAMMVESTKAEKKGLRIFGVQIC